MRPLLAFAVVLVWVLPAAAQTDPGNRYKMGHSVHGAAFDEGPRDKPVRMDGIGTTHFPITTKNPEVQMWFDQGHTLLHSYWFYEAERAFRWCLKLEPDNAMAYWGLSRASMNGDRARQFMKKALALKETVSPRERAYLEAWSLQEGDDPNRERFRKALEQIVLDYPDDIEAKVLAGDPGLTLMTGNGRIGSDLLLRQVLAKAPDHPGAHHYRVHLWDGPQGAQALDSCRRYGDIVPRIGHALHMPGHVYAGLGMWHEAAISLDSATRAEIRYMGERLVFPYNTWNYAHNRNYLSYVQEQLGLRDEAVRGARELLAVPLDPTLNDAERYSPHWQGVAALTRALVKFERWDEILAEGSIPWGSSVRDKAHRAWVESLAYFGKGDADQGRKRAADHGGMKAEFDKPELSWLKTTYDTHAAELDARVALSRGDVFKGLSRMAEAAELELKLRDEYDDPPGYPYVLYTELARAYLAQQSPQLAVRALDKALSVVPNEPFTLSIMAQAQAAAGARDKAADAWGRLLYVWSDASPGNPAFDRARALGLPASPVDRSPAKQRNYVQTRLDQHGPAIWTANPAPALDAQDSSGKTVTLEEFRGKNVLLVFYLGGTCVHCLTQLKTIGDQKDEFGRLDTVLLAVSSDRPEINAKSQDGFPFRLLSDEALANTKRFKSYDDFEEMPIHSTVLIDRQGRIHWARHGGDPFDDVKFLQAQLRRMNERQASASTSASK
jgi:peroxiredoxin/tetratricopeptide (TPR) repeat protein